MSQMSQMSQTCLLISLIKCLKGHKSLGSLCSVVKTLIVSGNGPTNGRTMSPIELFWTAKNGFQNLKVISPSAFAPGSLTVNLTVMRSPTKLSWIVDMPLAFRAQKQETM